MATPDVPSFTFREGVGGVIAVLVIGALCWSALVERSAAAETAIVGAAGSVAGWLFRGSGQPATNGNGYTSGSPGSGGGGTTTSGA